jgi:hypothetical protein
MFFILILLSYVVVAGAKKKVTGLSIRIFLRGGGVDGWSTAKYQIGPSDTPPCGRVPGFQTPSVEVSGVRGKTEKLKPAEDPAMRGRNGFSTLHKKSRAIADPALAFG